MGVIQGQNYSRFVDEDFSGVIKDSEAVIRNGKEDIDHLVKGILKGGSIAVVLFRSTNEGDAIDYIQANFKEDSKTGRFARKGKALE